MPNEFAPLTWRRDVKLVLYVGRLNSANRFLPHVDAVILRTGSRWFVIVIRGYDSESEPFIHLVGYKTKQEAEEGASRLVAWREQVEG